MYIISKKKDYYDGVAGTVGIDKTIIFSRETIEIDDNKKFPDFINSNKRNWKELREYPISSLGYYHINNEFCKKYDDYSYFIIGFCGKLYVGWKLYKMVENNLVTTITYDSEFMLSILKPRGFNLSNGLLDDIKFIENHVVLDVFRKYNSPIFVYDNDFERTSIGKYRHRKNEVFIVNPILISYEFYKVFDSFQAFQEISMFISGVLGNKEKEIIQVSDKNKIEQHGFDYKWSFRKEKQ